jgi:putative membrane protein
MPILQSRVRVESVRRIVVKQAQNLESTYYIIKELASDPKVARVIFIPAGVTFLVYAIDSLLKTNAAPMAIATMIGSYLLYKGLSLDSLLETFISNLRKSFQDAKLTFVTYLISLILIVMAFVRGSLVVIDKVVETSQPGIINLAAVFFNSAIWWFVVALLAVVIGWIIDAYTEDSESLHKYLATPFFLVAMGTLVWGGTQYILDMQDKMPEALKSLGIAILVAVVVSYLGVTFARYVRNLNQYRVVEVIDF